MHVLRISPGVTCRVNAAGAGRIITTPPMSHNSSHCDPVSTTHNGTGRLRFHFIPIVVILGAYTMSRKRKIEEENRSFQERWEEKYFFALCGDKITCLLCQIVLSVPKESNLKRHYETSHKTKYGGLEGKLRTEKVLQLKSSLQKQKALFTKSNNEADAAVEASYLLSEIIAKHSKPFSEGAFVKECLLAAVGIICPDKLQMFFRCSGVHMCVSNTSQK